MIICLFVWHSLATLPHTQQQRQLELVENCSNCSNFSCAASKFFTFIYDEDVNLAACCLLPVSACVCLSNCLSGTLHLCTQSVSVSHRRVFIHFQAWEKLMLVKSRAYMYLDYTLRLMCRHLIGSHRKGNSTPVFYTVKFPKQFNNISEMQIAQKKKRFTINKLFYDQISMNIYQMMRSGFF